MLSKGGTMDINDIFRELPEIRCIPEESFRLTTPVIECNDETREQQKEKYRKQLELLEEINVTVHFPEYDGNWGLFNHDRYIKYFAFHPRIVIHEMCHAIHDNFSRLKGHCTVEEYANQEYVAEASTMVICTTLKTPEYDYKSSLKYLLEYAAGMHTFSPSEQSVELAKKRIDANFDDIES
jgi:hypothetical protein